MTINLPANHIEAHRALANAVRVDEVKNVRDQAVAMQTYAAQAKDGELIAMATNIGMHAEIRAGELLIAMATSGERDRGHGDRRSGSKAATSKLADLGINKTQSSRWRKLAAMPPEKQEQTIRQRVRLTVASTEAQPSKKFCARHPALSE